MWGYVFAAAALLIWFVWWVRRPHHHRSGGGRSRDGHIATSNSLADFVPEKRPPDVPPPDEYGGD